MTTDKVYSNADWATSIDPDLFDVYQVQHLGGGVDLVCSGRTLYAHATDVGLTLTTGAPVIVMQAVEGEDLTAKGDVSLSIEEYSSIAAALNALEYEGKNFVGTIAADLNDRGTAEWIVISVGDLYDYVAKGAPEQDDTVTLTFWMNDARAEMDGKVMTNGQQVKVAEGDIITISVLAADGMDTLTVANDGVVVSGFSGIYDIVAGATDAAVVITGSASAN